MANKRVTMRDIAEKCGVSVATVSHALNRSSKENVSDLLRVKIIQTAARMCYQPLPGQALKTAAIILNGTGEAALASRTVRQDLAAQLVAVLMRRGVYATVVAGMPLAAVYEDEGLKAMHAWFMIDLDNEALRPTPQCFGGPVILLDGEAGEALACSIQTDYSQFYEKAAGILGRAPSFLLMEDIKSAPLAKLVMQPFAPAHVYIDRAGGNLPHFLARQAGRAGIALNEVLAAQTAGHFDPRRLVALCRMGGQEMLDSRMPRLFSPNHKKARVAADAMEKISGCAVEEGASSYVLIGATET